MSRAGRGAKRQYWAGQWIACGITPVPCDRGRTERDGLQGTRAVQACLLSSDGMTEPAQKGEKPDASSAGTPRRRRRSPDPRWAEANARHARVAPALAELANQVQTLISERRGAPGAGPRLSVQEMAVLDAGGGQARLVARVPPRPRPSRAQADWVALSGFKHVLYPKFQVLDPPPAQLVQDPPPGPGRGAAQPAVCDLYDTWIANDGPESRHALAHEAPVAIPAWSAFVMSDIRHMDSLLLSAAGGSGRVGECGWGGKQAAWTAGSSELPGCPGSPLGLGASLHGHAARGQPTHLGPDAQVAGAIGAS